MPVSHQVEIVLRLFRERDEDAKRLEEYRAHERRLTLLLRAFYAAGTFAMCAAYACLASVHLGYQGFPVYHATRRAALLAATAIFSVLVGMTYMMHGIAEERECTRSDIASAKRAVAGTWPIVHALARWGVLDDPVREAAGEHWHCLQHGGACVRGGRCMHPLVEGFPIRREK